MAKRTPAQVYADLIAAGASPQAARTLTEIAGAESGFSDSVLGDVKLENNTWGPSFGLFQIRTLKSQTGAGSERDIASLTGDDGAQAAAALAISKNGTDFSPWSTYTDGAYQAQATNVNAALAGIGAPAAASSSATPALFGIPGTSGITASIESLALMALGAAFGLALIGLGVAHLAAPAVKKAGDTVEKVGDAAAKAAVLA